MSLPTMRHVTLKKFENFSNVSMLKSLVGLIKYLLVYLKTADTFAFPLISVLISKSSTDAVTNHVACDNKEVRKLLKRLNAGKSCGIDKIPARLLKDC